MEKQDYELMARDIVDWFKESEHYSVVHYAVERGMSKQELLQMGEDSEVFKKALDYAFSVQEYKVVEGAISGKLDRASALKMLETYNGWKSDVSIYQNVSQSMSPELAERLAAAIERMDAISESLVEDGIDLDFGSVSTFSDGVPLDGGQVYSGDN